MKTVAIFWHIESIRLDVHKQTAVESKVYSKANSQNIFMYMYDNTWNHFPVSQISWIHIQPEQIKHHVKQL